MDSPTTIRSAGKPPEVLSPCGSRRRRSSCDSSSPEFEFWRVPNPSSSSASQPASDLISADELFLDGVLLPLHLLSFKSTHSPDPDASKPDPDPPPPLTSSNPPPPLVPETEREPKPGPVPGPELTRESAVGGSTASKRWRDIFRKSENKPPAKSHEEREKERENKRKKEKKSQTGSGSGSGTAELNINIWPFSRSRSAGNSVTRPRMSFGAPANRKVSSAPCSRSNSAGESKSSRKWPSSPGRPGVYLGRSSPVWQVRRPTPNGKLSSEPVVRGGMGGNGKREITETRRGKTVNESNINKAKVLNLNVPMCIGYRSSRLSCRSYESGSSNNRSGNCNHNHVGSTNSTSTATTTTTTTTNNNLFGLRHLFTKKVH